MLGHINITTIIIVYKVYITTIISLTDIIGVVTIITTFLIDTTTLQSISFDHDNMGYIEDESNSDS